MQAHEMHWMKHFYNKTRTFKKYLLEEYFYIWFLTTFKDVIFEELK